MQDLTLETFLSIEQYDYKRYPKLLRRAQRAQERKDIEARYMLERYSSIIEGQRKRITEWRTHLLLDTFAPEIMQKREPEFYSSLCKQAGKRGVALAEKQLTLYFINTHWALYLESMEDMRAGIHLVVIGNKNPIDEYMLCAASAFTEMLEDIAADVAQHMHTCKITQDGIDMEAAGLLAGTTTWTYLINESNMQFTRIPEMVKLVKSSVRGTLFTFREIYTSIKNAVSRIRAKRGMRRK